MTSQCKVGDPDELLEMKNVTSAVRTPTPPPPPSSTSLPQRQQHPIDHDVVETEEERDERRRARAKVEGLLSAVDSNAKPLIEEEGPMLTSAADLAEGKVYLNEHPRRQPAEVLKHGVGGAISLTNVVSHVFPQTKGAAFAKTVPTNANKNSTTRGATIASTTTKVPSVPAVKPKSTSLLSSSQRGKEQHLFSATTITTKETVPPPPPPSQIIFGSDDSVIDQQRMDDEQQLTLAFQRVQSGGGGGGSTAAMMTSLALSAGGAAPPPASAVSTVAVLGAAAAGLKRSGAPLRSSSQQHGVPTASVSCNIDHDANLVQKIILSYAQRQLGKRSTSNRQRSNGRRGRKGGGEDGLVDEHVSLRGDESNPIVVDDLFMRSIMSVSKLPEALALNANNGNTYSSSSSSQHFLSHTARNVPSVLVPTQIPIHHWVLRETLYDDKHSKGAKEDASAIADLASNKRSIVFPSANPNNRPEVYFLAQTLDVMFANIPEGYSTLASGEACYRILEEREQNVVGDDAYAEEEEEEEAFPPTSKAYYEAALALWDVLDAGFTEVSRQISPQCSERAALLEALRTVAKDVGTTGLEVMQYCKEEVRGLLQQEALLHATISERDARIAELEAQVAALTSQKESLLTDLADYDVLKARYDAVKRHVNTGTAMLIRDGRLADVLAALEGNDSVFLDSVRRDAALTSPSSSSASVNPAGGIEVNPHLALLASGVSGIDTEAVKQLLIEMKGAEAATAAKARLERRRAAQQLGKAVEDLAREAGEGNGEEDNKDDEDEDDDNENLGRNHANSSRKKQAVGGGDNKSSNNNNNAGAETYHEAVKYLLTLDEAVRAVDLACHPFYQRALFSNPALCSSVASGKWRGIAKAIGRHEMVLEQREKQWREAVRQIRREEASEIVNGDAEGEDGEGRGGIDHIKYMKNIQARIGNANSSSGGVNESGSSSAGGGGGAGGATNISDIDTSNLDDTTAQMLKEGSVMEQQVKFMHAFRASTRRLLGAAFGIGKKNDATGGNGNGKGHNDNDGINLLEDDDSDRDDEDGLSLKPVSAEAAAAKRKRATVDPVAKAKADAFLNAKLMLPPAYTMGKGGIAAMLKDTRAIMVEIAQRLCALATSAQIKELSKPPLLPPTEPQEPCPLCNRIHLAELQRRRRDEAMANLIKETDEKEAAFNAQLTAMRKELDEANARIARSLKHAKDSHARSAALEKQLHLQGRELQNLRNDWSADQPPPSIAPSSATSSSAPPNSRPQQQRHLMRGQQQNNSASFDANMNFDEDGLSPDEGGGDVNDELSASDLTGLLLENSGSRTNNNVGGGAELAEGDADGNEDRSALTTPSSNGRILKGGGKQSGAMMRKGSPKRNTKKKMPPLSSPFGAGGGGGNASDHHTVAKASSPTTTTIRSSEKDGPIVIEVVINCSCCGGGKKKGHLPPSGDASPSSPAAATADTATTDMRNALLLRSQHVKLGTVSDNNNSAAVNGGRTLAIPPSPTTNTNTGGGGGGVKGGALARLMASYGATPATSVAAAGLSAPPNPNLLSSLRNNLTSSHSMIDAVSNGSFSTQNDLAVATNTNGSGGNGLLYSGAKGTAHLPSNPAELLEALVKGSLDVASAVGGGGGGGGGSKGLFTPAPPPGGGGVLGALGAAGAASFRNTVSMRQTQAALGIRKKSSLSSHNLLRSASANPNNPSLLNTPIPYIDGVDEAPQQHGNSNKNTLTTNEASQQTSPQNLRAAEKGGGDPVIEGVSDLRLYNPDEQFELKLLAKKGGGSSNNAPDSLQRQREFWGYIGRVIGADGDIGGRPKDAPPEVFPVNPAYANVKSKLQQQLGMGENGGKANPHRFGYAPLKAGGHDPAKSGVYYPKMPSKGASNVLSNLLPAEEGAQGIAQLRAVFGISGVGGDDKVFYSSAKAPKSLGWLLKTITHFYKSKLFADLVTMHHRPRVARDGAGLQTPAAYLQTMLRNMYGHRAVITNTLSELSLACASYHTVDPRVAQFVRFLTDTATLPPPSKSKASTMRNGAVTSDEDDDNAVDLSEPISEASRSLFFFSRLSRAVDNCTVGLNYATSTAAFCHDEDQTTLQIVSLARLQGVLQQTQLIKKPYSAALWDVVCSSATVETVEAFRAAQLRNGYTLLNNELHPKDWSEDDVKRARMTAPKIVFLIAATQFEAILREQLATAEDGEEEGDEGGARPLHDKKAAPATAIITSHNNTNVTTNQQEASSALGPFNQTIGSSVEGGSDRLGSVPMLAEEGEGGGAEVGQGGQR